MKELQENEDPNFQPEDKYLETAEEQLMKFGKRVTDYAKLRRSTEVNPTDYAVMKE